MKELKHETVLDVGDGSGDGHGITDEVRIRSNRTSEEISIAYAKGALILGIDVIECVCADYEDFGLTPDQYAIFDKAGFGVETWKFSYDFDALDDFDRNEMRESIAVEEPIEITQGTFVELCLFTVKTGDPEFLYQIVKDPTPHFYIGGYGLFSN